MTISLSFKVRTVKNQIQACLRAISNGVKSFVDRLIILENELEKLEEKVKMKIQTKTGSESHTTNWRSATVLVNGKPIYEALKPLEKPEWELVGNKGKHGKWCVAEYSLPAGSAVKFIAKANGKEPIEFEFVVGQQVNSVDVDGYNYNNEICGWIVSI